MQGRHTPAAAKPTTDTRSQHVLCAFSIISPKNEVVFYQVEPIWGIHIQRNYIFHRRHHLDFLWVLKNKGTMEPREVGVVGKIKLCLITRAVDGKLS